MASLLDQMGLSGLDKRFQRFSADPLGMASLGLLLQPRRRPIGSSGFDYAVQGMQTAAQNRQAQAYAQRLEEETKARQQEQERQARVVQMLSAGATPEERALMASMSPDEFINFQKYRQDITQFQQRQIEAQQAKAQQERQMQAAMNYINTLPEPQRSLAMADPMKFVGAAVESEMRPRQMTSAERNALALGLEPGSAESNAYIRQVTTPQAPQINIGQPLSTSELKNIVTPEGKPFPLGTTMQQAIASGGVPRAEMTQEEKLAFEAQRASSQLSSKQAFSQQQAAVAVQRIGDALSRFSGMSALTPTDRAQYSSMLDAAANAIAKARGTPGAEPPAQAIDRARASLPSIEELLTAPVLGNTAEAKMRALLEEFGGGAQMTTPGGAQVTTDMKKGGWTTLPNGVRVRRKQ